MTSNTDELRQTLRSEALRQRNAIEENLRSAFSHLIKKSALGLIEELQAKTVHCYISFRSEVDTEALIHSMQSGGIKIVSPVTTVVNGVPMLEHYELTEERTRGAFGVPEPVKAKKIDPDTIDAVIVPVVAYDGSGARLGYGKGYYDRFLASLSLDVPKIGLAFSVQEVYEIPHLPHDIRLDYIVNEQAVVEIN